MSWIRSEQSLLHHPKTVLLKSYLKVDTATVIGRLHMLWWWCLDYAIDGDLSKKEVKVIEDACQIPVKMLAKAGFIDSRPYRRIHGWYEIQGNYLRARFKDKPEIWQRIKHLYEDDIPWSKHRSNNLCNTGMSPTDVQTYGRTDVTNGRTDVDTPRAGSAETTPAPTPGKVKDYDQAGDDELCGPPKDMMKKIREASKKVTPATD